MRLNSALAVAVALVAAAGALYGSDAGVIDWHTLNVGVPLTRLASAAPSFSFSTSSPSNNPDALLVTATESNVLAALHALNGSVAWRHIFDDADPVVSYATNPSTVAALSGPGGATLRVFERDTGALLSETRMHAPADGLLQQPDDLGSAIAFADGGDEDTYVLTSAHTVRRVGTDGVVKWTWTSPDQTSLAVYTRLISTPTAVYAIGLASSFASYQLHITSLDPQTGSPIASRPISSSIHSGPTDIVAFTFPPSVAWLEGGHVHALSLVDAKLGASPRKLKDAKFKSVVDLRLEGAFVGVRDDGAGVAVTLEEDGNGAKMYAFPDSASSDKYTDAFYVGAHDGARRPYVARVFWSHVLRSGAVHTYAPHLADGKGLLSGFTFAFDTGADGVITHATVHVPHVKATDILPYVALTTSTGSVQLWRGDVKLWAREEGLAEVKVAEMVELPAVAEDEMDVFAGGEGVFGRLERQIVDAQHLPRFILGFINRFLSSTSTSTVAVPTSPSNQTTPLARDALGLRKLIIAATARGKLYALDSTNGHIVWSRLLGTGPATDAEVFPIGVYELENTTTASEDANAREVVLVGQRRAANGILDTVAFHVDAMTGRDVRRGKDEGRGVLEGQDVIPGGAIAVVPVRGEFVLLLDEFRQAYVYPDTAATRASFDALLPTLYIPLVTSSSGSGSQLTGHVLAPSLGTAGRALAQPTWTSSLAPPAAPGRAPLALVRPPRGDVIASPGKVLGNRTTLYKYLNPHLSVVVGESGSACAVRVVDGVKGSVVYDAVVPRTEGGNGGGGCDIQVAMVENWLVYVYWDPEWQWAGQAKGRRIVSAELYEGEPDRKTGSEGLSSFHPDAAKVTVYERAFAFPAGVTAMATTRTTYGVTSKDLIVATDRGQIMSVPRVLLNPRRVKGKPTTEDQEEMLLPYEPVLPDDPRRVVSHRYHVANVRGILTSPALLESTSLVFAYGLDLFGTRVAPSKQFDVLSASFNKAQLALTVAGLAAAVMAAKPAVRRKKLRERWYRS